MEDTSITALLRRWNSGEEEAANELVPRVYSELRQIASRQLVKERKGHTLRPTALVHEAFLRLSSQNQIEWQSRAQFLGFSAHLMRQILVDYARARNSDKRGGKIPKVTLNGVADFAHSLPDLLALDDALRDLGRRDPQKVKIIELRFFGGLTIPETAELLGVSAATVVRQWRGARAWLYKELVADAPGESYNGGESSDSIGSGRESLGH
ncbi:MAG: sigma-70 family RNA polymerase sigma factor [Deltaproteobacteria bacterium]|nr:sigma-70 family RNA polymerase sigma factor [Deltaproteobacteria bacterium]